MRILVIEDEPQVAGHITRALVRRGHSSTAQHDGAAGLRVALEQPHDLVVLDLNLPSLDGLGVLAQLRKCGNPARVLILTSVIDDNLVYEAMSSGAHGYLLKEINAQGLCQAIIDVAAGKFILDPAVTTRVLSLVRNGPPQSEQDKLAQLSTQERRVLALVAEGKTNKEIAEQMTLSDKTVKNYLSNIFEKLKINRRSQAAVLFAENRGSPKVPSGPSR